MEKSKKPFYKKAWFWIIIIILIMMFNGGESANQLKIDTNGPVAEITYTPVTIEKLFDDLAANPAKAEHLYQDNYIEITGKINVIDSDGQYISIESSNDKYWLESVSCYIQNEDQLNVIFEKTKGDKVTIKGQITSIGEIMGYSMDVHSIE